MVDDRDSVPLRLQWAADFNGFSFPQNLARVPDVDSARDLDQSGFSGPILTNQAVDLSPIDGKRHIFQRLHPAKPFADGLVADKHIVFHKKDPPYRGVWSVPSLRHAPMSKELA